MARANTRRREMLAARQAHKQDSKPANPHPIRHKAHQKAIHNARRGGRAGGRGGGRGGGRAGGQASRNQGNPVGNNPGNAEQEFVATASVGNNFHVLNSLGARAAPIKTESMAEKAPDDDDTTFFPDDAFIKKEDGETTEDMEMYDIDEMMINVQVDQVDTGNPIAKPAKVMFTIEEAMPIYLRMQAAGFPTPKGHMVRYGPNGDGSVRLKLNRPGTWSPIKLEGSFQAHAMHTHSLIPFPSVSMGSQAPLPHQHVDKKKNKNKKKKGEQQVEKRGEKQVKETGETKAELSSAEQLEAARDYVFHFGPHKGVPFNNVPQKYLKRLANNPMLFVQRPTTKAAFDYHRPGMVRMVPPWQIEHAMKHGRCLDRK